MRVQTTTHHQVISQIMMTVLALPATMSVRPALVRTVVVRAQLFRSNVDKPSELHRGHLDISRFVLAFDTLLRDSEKSLVVPLTTGARLPRRRA